VSPVLSSRALFWSLLAVPAILIVGRWAAEPDPWLADYIAETGLWSARLLIVALCLTPLRQLIGPRVWLNWLIQRRRAIGVAAFLYLLLHLAFYVADMASLAAILGEALIPSMLAGWLGLAAMLPPALASNDAAMRMLKANWKRVQRLVYAVAVATLIHWLLVHDGRTEALLHFLPLALLQSLRLARTLYPFPKPRSS
jgi:methionine sulfoxide reductase heme-binding subunit